MQLQTQGWHRRRFTAALVGLAVVASAGIAQGAHAQARRPQVQPATGQWCGLADSGSVRMTVSTDGRFVEYISVDTERGSLSSESAVVRRAQIADEQFIFKSGDDVRDRCEPARCEGPNCPPRGGQNNRPGTGGGTRCGGYPSTGITIRGHFLAPDYVRGTYTGAITVVVQPGNQRGGSAGDRTVTRRVVGTYVAWPASAAPCP